MTALPAQANFTGAGVKQGTVKTAFNDLRSYLAGTLGTDGTILTALQTLGVPGSGVLVKSGAYTVTTSDRGRVLDCSGTWSLALPAAATAGDGFCIGVRNTGTGVITVDPNSSETVNGASTAAVLPGMGALLVCSGTAWIAVGSLGDTPIMLPDGSAAAPALAFGTDQNTGVYSIGADQLGFSTNGTLRLTLSTTALTSTLPALLPDGSASAPAVSFSGDTNTGIYRIGADQLGFSTGGTLRLTLSTTALTSTLPALLPDGSAAAPAFSFSGDTNTGIYRVGADQIGFATNGTLRATLGTGAFALNLPITGTSVQSSATDATAGRVLLAGASATVLSASPALRATYGGTANAITLTSGASISGTIPTGLMLRFRASAANTGATTIALDGGSTVACRTITGIALPSGYIRTDADTVAIYDGTNWVLGRETERGSNANGEYVVYADGRQECRHVVGSVAITTAYAGLYRSGLLSWTFPGLAFIAGAAQGPQVFGNVLDLAGMFVISPYGSRTTSASDLRAYAGASVASASVHYTAIGRVW